MTILKIGLILACWLGKPKYFGLSQAKLNSSQENCGLSQAKPSQAVAWPTPIFWYYTAPDKLVSEKTFI